MTRRIVCVTMAAVCVWLAPAARAAQAKRTMNVLFIGNSFTARHDIAKLVKTLAAEGLPDLEFTYTKVIYGGRNLKQHWEQFRSQTVLQLADLTKADLDKTCAELAKGQAHAKTLTGRAAKDAGRYRVAIRHHKRWTKLLGGKAPEFDCVVLQSWRDVKGGLESPYAEYARRFAKLAHQHGAKVVLYATSPYTQNAKPLPAPPDTKAAVADARFLAALAAELDASVVPMPLVVNTCQRGKPDLTLRWPSDGHGNQACGYMTACAVYAVLFGKSPVGLTLTEVTDTRVVDRKNPEKGIDGQPRRVVFSDDLRAFLQKTAWEGVQAYRKIAAKDK